MNKTVSIQGDDVRIDGQLRVVVWGDTAHTDCTGKVISVESGPNGKVRLENGAVFENPEAINCADRSQTNQEKLRYRKKAWPCCSLEVEGLEEESAGRACAMSAINVVSSNTQSRNMDPEAQDTQFTAGWITVKNMKAVCTATSCFRI